VHRIEVVVDVQPLILGRRFCWRYTVLLSSAQSGHRQESQCFHVSAAFNSLGFGLPLPVIADVRVAAEEHDWDVPSDFTDGIINQVVLLAVLNRHVASNQEKVNVLRPDGILKPLLLHYLLHILHNSVVSIAVEVEQEPKCDDPDALVFSGEFAESGSQWFQFASLWILNVQVGSNVRLLEVRHGVVVLVLARIAQVQLVVATRDHVDVLVLEDIKSVFALGLAGIVEAIAFDAISRVDQEQV